MFNYSSQVSAIADTSSTPTIQACRNCRCCRRAANSRGTRRRHTSLFAATLVGTVNVVLFTDSVCRLWQRRRLVISGHESGTAQGTRVQTGRQGGQLWDNPEKNANVALIRRCRRPMCRRPMLTNSASTNTVPSTTIVTARYESEIGVNTRSR